MPLIRKTKADYSRAHPVLRGPHCSVIAATKEFQDAMAVLNNGSIGPYEVIELPFDSETLEILKLELKEPIHTMAGMLRRRVKELRLSVDVRTANEVVYLIGR